MGSKKRLLIYFSTYQIVRKLKITVFIQIEVPGAKTKFWGGASFQKSKDQYIIGIVDSDNDCAHKHDLDYEPMDPGH